METKKYRSRIKAWAIFFWCIDTSIADTLTPSAPSPPYRHVRTFAVIYVLKKGWLKGLKGLKRKPFSHFSSDYQKEWSIGWRVERFFRLKKCVYKGARNSTSELIRNLNLTVRFNPFEFRWWIYMIALPPSSFQGTYAKKSSWNSTNIPHNVTYTAQRTLIIHYIFLSLPRNWLTPFLQLWPLHIHRR